MTTRVLAGLLAACLAAPAPASAAVASRAWDAPLSRVAAEAAARPALLGGDAALGRIVGHLRVELATAGPGAAREIVSRLPPPLAADPAAFSALDAGERARLVGDAARRARAELSGPAAETLAAVTRGSGRERRSARKRLPALAASWYLFDGGLGRDLRFQEAWRRRDSLAGRLLGRFAAPEDALDQRLVDAELRGLFDGLEVVARARSEDAAPADAFVAAGAAPYLERALESADRRLRERGLPPQRLPLELLTARERAFGFLAPRGLEGLFRAGEWRESSVRLLEAAVKLVEASAAVGGERSGQLKALRDAAADPGFRTRLPGGGLLSDRLAVHGPPSPVAEGPGFEAFGIEWRLGKPSVADVVQLAANAALSALFFAAAAGLPLWAGALLGSALCLPLLIGHELGHALVLRLLGRDAAITVSGATALTSMRFPLSPPRQMAFAAAGAAANLLMAVAGLLLLPLAGGPVLTAVAWFWVWGNLGTAAASLLWPSPANDTLVFLAGAAAQLSRRSVDDPRRRPGGAP